MLIDFTKSKEIALSFAAHPAGNLNAYNKTNASLVVLLIKSREKDVDINKINLDYHANKLKVDNEIYGKPLYKCTINDFDATFGLSTKATNDSMRYQQGVFFLFL